MSEASGLAATATGDKAIASGDFSVATGIGTWQGQTSTAMSFSHAINDGHTVIKASANFTSAGSGGGACIGWQF